MPAAADWYAEFLGVRALLRPARAGRTARPTSSSGSATTQDELGIIDRRYAPPGAATAPGGAIMHWHVDDLEGTVQRLLALGATEYEPITPRGEGFVTASVVDPFGNVLGVMYNPHYLEMLGATRTA